MSRRIISTSTRGLAAATALSAAAGFTPSSQAGLRLLLKAGGVADEMAVSNVWLHTEPAATPSPFLPAANAFTATWSGTVSVDLRGDYRFQAEHAGAFRLEINGTNVLGTAREPGTTDWSAPVRLRKGTNSLRAVLEQTPHQSAQVRLFWQGRGLSPSAIPSQALEPDTPTDPTSDSQRRARGRALFLRLRCARCHAVEAAEPSPDLTRDAPGFVGLGSRLQAAWLREWVLNPADIRPDTEMPSLLRGATAESDASAIADWLSSLRAETPPQAPTGVAAAGKALAERLRCGVCHTAPGENPDPARITLSRVADKFIPGQVSTFLLEPGRNFTWTRMPNFHLKAEEARNLEAWLKPLGRDGEQVPPGPVGAERARAGRELAGKLGCFNCHDHPETGRLRTPSLAEISVHGWTQGCVADDVPGRPVVPEYRFSAEERQDLRAFGAGERGSLGRHVPAEFAGRMLVELRCRSCHDGSEGMPALEGVGAKLRPEWTARLLSGRVGAKTRPWLAARMPAFAAVAEPLAAGLAAQQGIPPRSPVEPPMDEVAAEEGRKLVSSNRGFSCVTCHSIGGTAATTVSEAPAVNFVLSAERLLPDYFARWVRDPLAIEPTTKMPLYFDTEGNSTLTEFYGGDGPKTIHALWQYLRHGPAMKPPSP